MLIDNQLKPNFTRVGAWQHRRETEFWNIEVNDILYANYEGLRRIFKSFFH